MRAIIVYSLFIIWGVGCANIAPPQAPSSMPRQLSTFVRLDERSYYATAFTVRYPSGWRVVKLNEANQPDRVVFASPNETQTIEIGVGALENVDLSGGDYRTDLRTAIVNGQIITVIGRAPQIEWEAFSAVLDAVVTSLRGSSVP